jgi:hypothetical protein
MMSKVRGKRSITATIAANVPTRKVADDRDGPTPEQRRHANYEQQDIVDKLANGVSIKIGKAYRRHPLFETMWKQNGSGISVTGLFALRYYRARHEETEQSLTRCALDVQGRGGGADAPLPRGVDAFMLVGEGVQRTVERLEQAMGAVADTVRAIAIDDRSYSDVAIGRWGSRKQSWITQPNDGRAGKAAHVEKVVPKSGRHREIVRQEFLLGLGRLVQAVQVLTASAAETKQVTRPMVDVDFAPAPANDSAPPSRTDIDPAYLNEQGHLLPWDEIAEIILARVGGQSGAQ